MTTFTAGLDGYYDNGDTFGLYGTASISLPPSDATQVSVEYVFTLPSVGTNADSGGVIKWADADVVAFLDAIKSVVEASSELSGAGTWTWSVTHSWADAHGENVTL